MLLVVPNESLCSPLKAAASLNAAVHQIITRADPALGLRVHKKQKAKPFSLAILPLSDHEVGIRITFVSDLAGQLTNILLQALAQNQEIRIGRTVCPILRIDFNGPQNNGMQTWVGLLQPPFSRKIHIEFLTPVAFSKKGNSATWIYFRSQVKFFAV